MDIHGFFAINIEFHPLLDRSRQQVLHMAPLPGPLPEILPPDGDVHLLSVRTETPTGNAMWLCISCYVFCSTY